MSAPPTSLNFLPTDLTASQPAPTLSSSSRPDRPPSPRPLEAASTGVGEEDELDYEDDDDPDGVEAYLLQGRQGQPGAEETVRGPTPEVEEPTHSSAALPPASMIFAASSPAPLPAPSPSRSIAAAPLPAARLRTDTTARRWTLQEEETLRRMKLERARVSEIAAALDRTESSVKQRWTNYWKQWDRAGLLARPSSDSQTPHPNAQNTPTASTSAPSHPTTDRATPLPSSNAHPWTNADEEQLRQLRFEQRKPLEEVAAALGRTVIACEARAKKLKREARASLAGSPSAPPPASPLNTPSLASGTSHPIWIAPRPSSSDPSRRSSSSSSALPASTFPRNVPAPSAPPACPASTASEAEDSRAFKRRRVSLDTAPEREPQRGAGTDGRRPLCCHCGGLPLPPSSASDSPLSASASVSSSSTSLHLSRGASAGRDPFVGWKRARVGMRAFRRGFEERDGR